MHTYTTKYGISQLVNVQIDSQLIRWCTITAIKIEENSIKYDLQTQLSGKLYDIPEMMLHLIEEQSIASIQGEGK